MKKLLFLVMVLLVSGAILAQGNREKTTAKSFISLQGGPSFPVGDFASNDYYNDYAGFAKTGFNVNLSYGYNFFKNLGLTASVFYNNNTPDNAAIDELFKDDDGDGEISHAKMNNWQWYGITAGPMFSHNLVSNLSVNLRVMGGIANAKFPEIIINNDVAGKHDWSVAGIFQTGLDLKWDFGRNMFVFTNLDYQYMKSEFSILRTEDFTPEDEPPILRREQKLSALNLTGGFGIRF